MTNRADNVHPDADTIRGVVEFKAVATTVRVEYGLTCPACKSSPA